MNVSPPWICDSCEKPITSVEAGRVERIFVVNLESHKYEATDIRLVHREFASPWQDGCHREESPGQTVSHFMLQHYLGANGLMYLLSLATEGELPVPEVHEMVKRLHIPNYEFGRHHVGPAYHEGVINVDPNEGFLTQGDLERVIEWARKMGRKPLP